MQVSKINAVINFTPVDVTFRIETPEEMRLLKILFGRCSVIPNFLVNEKFLVTSEIMNLESMMNKIFSVLVRE